MVRRTDRDRSELTGRAMTTVAPRAAEPGGNGVGRPARAAEIPDDFRTLDFGRLWLGRDRTTEVEAALVRAALARFPVRRVVELGTGEGRLTATVREIAAEYVGVDQNFEFLRRLRRGADRGATTLLVEANLYHLPFVEGAVTASLLARVYNFLTEPAAALAEIRRTLAPGGGLVLSCHARPSVMTFADDVRAALDPPRGVHRPSLTFSRADVVPAIPSPFPAFSPTRKFLRRTIREAGFRIDGTLGSGFEDYRWSRRLPARLFLAAGERLGRAPWFPL
ncbi:MAG TPA: class I SAM-dependent methyltransferase, partial [Thermoplasmata archaeon]|nr:class I SAM-dependent methyltransferase [Thermoplasmata archaeon]